MWWVILAFTTFVYGDHHDLSCSTQVKVRDIFSSAQEPGAAVDGDIKTSLVSQNTAHFFAFRVPRDVPLCFLRVYWGSQTPEDIPFAVFVAENSDSTDFEVLQVIRSKSEGWSEVPINNIMGAGWIGIRARGVSTSGVVNRRISIGEFQVFTSAMLRDPCPIGRSGILCDGHGRCGRHGECLCNTDYYGPSCSLYKQSGPTGFDCPKGETGVQCSGHGSCNRLTGQCECYNGGVQPVFGAVQVGYWQGRTCDSCVKGWYGGACAARCQGDANVVQCSGHGACFDGVEGTGACICFPGWRGSADCSTRDNFGVCLVSCRFGKCDGNGVCNCLLGWGGFDCSVSCPQTTNGTCNRRGQCNQRDGTCICNAGWTGDKCHVRTDIFGCPAFNGQECGGTLRGACGFNGACTCSIAFTGNACQSCAEGRSGDNCERKCPVVNGMTCAGRGVCTKNSLCECYVGWSGSSCTDSTGILNCPRGINGNECSGPNRGFCLFRTCQCNSVFTGDSCSDCAVGRGGTNCYEMCPVADKKTCGGHGMCINSGCACDNGWGGVTCMESSNDQCPTFNGQLCGGPTRGECEVDTCKCTSRFAGPACEICNAQFEGFNCETFTCPRDTFGNICSGRGHCGETSGRCFCQRGWLGAWCHIPDTNRCPIGFNEDICHGHGTCSDVTNSCTCSPGWSGVACDFETSVGCPFFQGVECGGFRRGTCQENGRCQCAPRFTGDACETCAFGRVGNDCDIVQQCPTLNGFVCGGPLRGACRNSRCECTDNFRGIGCEQCALGRAGANCDTLAIFSCQSIGGLVCGGPTRGECTDRNTCTCFAFYSGPNCESCVAGRTGVECGVATLDCPVGINQLTCSGQNRGSCVGASNAFTPQTCTCEFPYAGVACETCVLGRTGTFCDIETFSQDCPTQVFGSTCSGRGSCVLDNNNNPLCSCRVPFGGNACQGCISGRAGPNCDIDTGNRPCANTCNNRGACVDGVCFCDPGFAGSSCQLVTCPTNIEVGELFGVPCSGPARGTCDSATARCACGVGFTGVACQTCQVGRSGPNCQVSVTVPSSCVIGNSVCAGRGTCSPFGFCVCVGVQFAGEKCELCAAGLTGNNCDILVQATQCASVNTLECSGFGVCNGFTRQCQCNQNRFGEACECNALTNQCLIAQGFTLTQTAALPDVAGGENTAEQPTEETGNAATDGSTNGSNNAQETESANNNNDNSNNDNNDQPLQPEEGKPSENTTTEEDTGNNGTENNENNPTESDHSPNKPEAGTDNENGEQEE